MSYRVAMDIGGTFTDFVVVDDERRETSAGKTSTTPARPEEGASGGVVVAAPGLLRALEFDAVQGGSSL